MNSLEHACDIWRQRPRWVVLSGAGVSTASGIGDYRDEQGDWKRQAPIMHQDFVDQLATRQRYWARSQRGFPEFQRAQPNPAHRCLAGLATTGKVTECITQNVDELHQRAGQARVIDLHGRLGEVVCLQCHTLTARADLQVWLERENPAVEEDFYTQAPDGDADTDRMDFSAVNVPVCTCGGILKPNVVFYGGSVPRAVVEACYRAIDNASGLLVVGSSLMVYSSFRFVRYAHQQGLPILAINQGKTRGDALFDAKLSEDCATGLTALTLNQPI